MLQGSSGPRLYQLPGLELDQVWWIARSEEASSWTGLTLTQVYTCLFHHLCSCLQTIRLQTQQRLEYFQQQVTAQTAECLADTEAPCYVACSALSGRLLSGAVPASSSQSQVDPGSSRQQHSSRRRDGAASKSRNRSSEDESQPARAGPLMCSSLLDTHVLAPQMLAGEDPLPSHAVLLSGSVPPSHSGGLAEPLRSYAGAAAASTDAQAGTLAPPAASAGGARPPEASEPLGSRADQLSEHKCNAQLAAASADAASEFSASDSGSFWERDGNDADGLRASHPDLEGFERIGRGAFGSVYRGMWRNKEVALKVRLISLSQLAEDGLPQGCLDH